MKTRCGRTILLTSMLAIGFDAYADFDIPWTNGRSIHVYDTTTGTEADVNCGPNLQADDRTYAPTTLFLKMSQDSSSRYYLSEISWNSSDFISYFAKNKYSGFKLKINLYNYQNAPAKGWGPSYGAAAGIIGGNTLTWIAASIPFQCDLPNCFREIGDLSAKALPTTGPPASFVEYSEPLFGYGMFDGQDSAGNPLLRVNRGYLFASRMPSGRGDKSLMKVRYTTTTQIGGTLPWQILQCNDNFPVQFLKYDNLDPVPPIKFPLPKRVFAPNCMNWYYSDPSGHSFNSASFCPL